MALRGSSLLSLSGDTRERIGRRGLLGDGFTMDTPEYRAAAMLGAGNTVSGQVPQWFGGNIDTEALQRAIEANGVTYGEKKKPDETFTGALPAGWQEWGPEARLWDGPGSDPYQGWFGNLSSILKGGGHLERLGFSGDILAPPIGSGMDAGQTLDNPSSEFLNWIRSNGYRVAQGGADSAGYSGGVRAGLFDKSGRMLAENSFDDSDPWVDAVWAAAPIAMAALAGAVPPMGAELSVPSSIGAAELPMYSTSELLAGFPSLPAAESAALAEAAGAGAATVASAPMSLAEAATQAIESGGLQAGTFGSGMESLSPGLLSGGGGYLTTAANGAPGLLSTLQSGASAISQFAKDNPLLTKLGMAAAGGLLGGVGGTSSPTQYTGPAKQWSSPLQTGIVNPVQQVMPGAIQNNPNALAVQGNPYAGAWQYLRGG